MEMSRRNALIYGLLLAVWALIIGWQAGEHLRVRRIARVALGHRARDISTTLGTVLRVQRRFGGIVSRERVESALADLLKFGDINGIALLSSAGRVVASAGSLTGGHTNNIAGPAEFWDKQSVTLRNLVDLGTNVARDIEGSLPPIVIPRDEMFRPGSTNLLTAPRHLRAGPRMLPPTSSPASPSPARRRSRPAVAGRSFPGPLG